MDTPLGSYVTITTEKAAKAALRVIEAIDVDRRKEEAVQRRRIIKDRNRLRRTWLGRLLRIKPIDQSGADKVLRADIYAHYPSLLYENQRNVCEGIVAMCKRSSTDVIWMSREDFRRVFN